MYHEQHYKTVVKEKTNYVIQYTKSNVGKAAIFSPKIEPKIVSHTLNLASF